MTRTTASLIAILWAAAITGPATAQTDEVTVLRGAGSEGAATAQSAEGGVAVLRGTPVTSRPPPERSYRTTPVLPFVAAGETLWLRDARTGRLVACRTGSSGHVGRSVIRCTTR